MTRLRLLPLALLLVAAGTLYPRLAGAQSQYVRTVEDRDHVTVMEFGGVYDHQPEANRAYEEQVRQAITREFLRTHTDDYDFVVAFSRFNYSLGTDSEGAHVGGRYYGIRNDIAGIGLEPFDGSAQWGSASGQLQGFIDMGVLSRLATDPTDPKFEQTLSILAHELLHRWGAHVRFRMPDGSLSSDLLGREGSHWSFLLNTHNSVHYGQQWRDNGNGTFTSTGRSLTFYSPLDLYLMGLLDKSQVPPFFLIRNADIPASRLPEVGTTISGTKQVVTIDDVIAAEGDRAPSAATAQKTFKIGFVFLVRPGEQADGLELAQINAVREAFSTRMLILTGGKGLVQVYPDQPPTPGEPPTPITPPSSGPRSGPADLAQGLDWILSRQAVDGSFADSSSTRVRDTAAVLDLLRESPSSFTAHEKGLAWLSQLQERLNVDMVSRRLLAIQPQFSATDAAFLNEARNASGGWGLRKGYQSDPLDTALALAAAPTPGSAADLAYLLGTQNLDGGWGVRPGSASSIQGTLASLRLRNRYTDQVVGTAMQRATDWLAAQQNGDGGFGRGGSTVFETADAVLFLLHTSFPKAQIAQALDYLRSQQLADGSWNESTYQTALALRALKVGELPNAAISASGIALSVQNPVDGQSVNVRAVIVNDSVRDLQNLTVSLFDGEPAQGGVQIGTDLVVANLPALSQLPVTFGWDTTSRAGNHQLFVVLDRDNQLNEFNEADNRASAAVTIRQPPVEPDLTVTQADIAFMPALLQALPQDETLTATITNAGQTTATDVVVTVFDGDPSGGRKVGETSVTVPGRGKAPATVAFTVDSTGDHRYYVVVDPGNLIVEADETNNVAFGTLIVQSTHDFVVDPGSVTVSENPSSLGRDLTLSAVIRNQGTTDAFAVPVRLTIEDPAGAIDVASLAIDLPAGSSKPVTAVWRTSRALNAVPVAAVIDPANAFPESSESNNRATTTLTVSSSSQPNLRVAPGSVQVPAPVDEGIGTTIAIPVLNNGAAAVTDVTVMFYAGLPANGGVQIGAAQVIPSLAAGAQVTASVSWTPATRGDVLLYASVDAANAVAEFDETDNTAFTTVSVRSRPDLAISPSAMSFIPAFPKQGEPVVVTAIVSNTGQQAASARVRFFEGDPVRGGIQIGQDQVIAVAGLGQATAQTAFAGDGASTRVIFVQVDPLNEIPELDEMNNVASRVIGIQDSSFYVSNLYFSPNGDDRQDLTELFFRFEAPQTLQAVTIYNAQHAVVRRLNLGMLATTASSALWDGRDDNGRVVPDGPYDMAVTSAAGVDLGSARVVVDTNNLPVSAALGTSFLLDTNLTCRQTWDDGGYIYEKVGWLPDDSGLVQVYPAAWIQRGSQITHSDKAVGIYLTTPDGATTTRLTPDSWAVHPPAGDGTQIVRSQVSKDGRTVAMAIQKYRVSSGSLAFFGPVEFWAVNTDGAGLRKVAQTPNDAYIDAPYFYHLEMFLSPDGERLAYWVDRVSGSTTLESRIYVARTDGSGQVLAQSLDARTNSLEDVAWSPDSARLLFTVLEPFAPTSLITRLYAMEPDGTNRISVAASVRDLDDLSEGDPDDWTVAWVSPTKLAFATTAELTPDGYFQYGDAQQVYLLSLDGTAPQLLSRGGGYVDSVARAPQGGGVAFVEADPGNDYGDTVPRSHRVWVVNADGEARTIYTSGDTSLSVGQLAMTGSGDHVSWIEQLVTTPHTCLDRENGREYPCPDTVLAIGAASLPDGTVSLVKVPNSTTTAEHYNSIEAIGLFPDGKSYLFADNGQLLAMALADGAVRVLSDDENARWYRGVFSPSGKYFLYQSRRETLTSSSACWKGMEFGEDEFAMSSLLNLTAQFTFTRDRSQLSVRGIAQDANFARYQLDYAPASDATNWAPIGTSSGVPVVNGLLSEWIPPAAGSYYVRLTAEDKAGNSHSTRQRITWGVAPSITNVSIEPRTFSPNADGTRDTVTIEYLVLGPINLTFEVFNAANVRVRTIQQSHTQLGAASLAWDGRDDTGQFVANGTYRVHVLDYDFFVVVDTVSPALAVSIGSGFHTIPQKVSCVDPAKGAGCVVIPGPLVETPYFELGGSVEDSQLAQWRLEVGTGTNPTDWQFVADGTTNHPATTSFERLKQIDRVVNRRYRLTATDQAGNRSSVISDFGPQEVILYAYDGSAVNTAQPIDQRLGQHALSLAYTGRTVPSSMTVQYRLLGSPVWGNGPVTAPPQGAELSWDNSTLSPGKIYEVRVLVVDVNGTQYASNTIQIRSNVFLMLQFLPELNIVPGIISLSESIKDLRLVRAADDGDIGNGSTYSASSVEFAIGVRPDPSIPPCGSRPVPARFKAVGTSGTVYYSNAQVVTQGPEPSMVSCPGKIGFEGALDLRITATEAASCGLPAPGQTTITLLADNLIEPKLFVQLVPNGPLQLMSDLTLQLNTLTMPEGVYNVRGTGRLPQEGQPEVSKSGTFVVKRTPLVSQITYPATNQPFCSAKQGSRSIVQVEGIAEDPHFKRYVVEFGAGDNPQNWVPITPPTATSPRRGVVADWDVTGFPTGTYSLRQRAYDQAGNLACSVVSFVLAGPVRIENASADLRLISPNGDGIKDATLVSYELRDPASVSARVYAIQNGQRSATPIRTLFVNATQLAGVNSFVWDGFADNGSAPADGTYAIVVSGGDTCGTSGEGIIEVVVDTTRPEAVIAAPVAGSTLGMVTDVRGTTTDAHFATYRLEVGESDAPVNWTSLASGSAPVQNGLIGKWTRSAAPATYTLRLTATDAAGNSRSTVATVTAAATGGLIDTLAAEPTVFSPNLDGRVDETTVSYQIGADARVRLELVDATDTVVRVLAESDALASSGYTFTWDGRNAAGADVADGTYTVRLTATSKADAARTQVERTTVVVDRTAPEIAVTVPTDGAMLHGPVAVTGTVTDPHLESYTVAYTSLSSGTATPIDQGTQSRSGHLFGTVTNLPDGRYTLTLSAKDVAGNSATKTVTFGVDNTLPQVMLVSPVAESAFGGQQESLAITGTVQDVNLQNWTLRVGAGSDPQAWTTLASGTTAVAAAAPLAQWSASVGDGLHTISLLATDKAGQAGETRTSVSVDRTAPTARIAQPIDQARINAGILITGTASDAHFKSAVLELSPGAPATASRFSPLTELAQPVTDGPLFAWQALPPDGVYTLRLRVEDELGQTSDARIQVTVDTEPPRPATNLAASVEARKNGRLAWSASPDADVTGYHVYRDGSRITPTPVSGTTFVDANLTEGRYRYVVKAVDSTDLESGASNEAAIQINLTPPATRIQSPAAGATVSGIVEIRGTAAATDDFKEYRVLVGLGATPASFSLVRRSPAPVTGGVLAEYDTAGRPEGTVITIRLEAEDIDGNMATDQIAVSIDNIPPAAPVLVSAIAAGADATIQWQAGGTDSDVAGYLLYNNDLLANVRRIVSGSTTPYLLTGTSYLDKALPDGEHKYYAVAVDRAGNVSASSNLLTVTTETRAPRATITQPGSNARTEHSVLLVATTIDEDVARVQFQMKAASASTWTNLGGAVTVAPYQVTWDPGTLPFGDYQFRAVATDTHNNTDTAPPSITITLRDLTPPAAPTAVAAVTTADSVTLTWPAVSATDLDGYAVYRRGPLGDSFVRVSGTLITTTTFVDSGRVDGNYTYVVRAIDKAANESPASPEASAAVYTPVLLSPAACVVATTTTLTGFGAPAGATLSLIASSPGGPALVGTTTARVDGTFTFDEVPLVAGINSFSAEGRDAAGNVSRRSTPLAITQAGTPAAPANFAADATATGISLTWDPDPAVAGYALVRNDTVITATQNVAGRGTATDSSREANTFRAARATDGDPSTFWMPASFDVSPWWQVSVPSPIFIDRIEIQWLQQFEGDLEAPASFLVQRYDGSSWVTVKRFEGNDTPKNTIDFVTPLSASRIRIADVTGDVTPKLAEVRILSRQLITGTSYTDSSVTDGRFTYKLSAVNACGVEGPPSEAPVSIGDVVAPSIPSALVATADGSRVSLTWAGVADADVAGYHVYRRGNDTWARVNVAPVPVSSFEEPAVANGTYWYRVTAVDVKGNESDPSNEAAVTVHVPPPAAPGVLAVTAPADGGALDLVWQASTGPVAGYRVLRSQTAGGPYVPASPTLVTSLAYRDAALANGTRYFYVVEAVDAAGNASAPSNEASGIPADRTAPAAPLLLYPTDAAHPRTVPTASATVTGVAEPGATVTLLRDGLTIAETTALTAPETQPLAIAGVNSASDYLATEGLLAVFTQAPDAEANTLTVVDTIGGVARSFSEAADGAMPSFSPAGDRIVFLQGGSTISILDRTTGHVTSHVRPHAVSSPVFGPDGQSIAYVGGISSSTALWIFEPSTGNARSLAAAPFIMEPVWSPTGAAIAFVEYHGSDGTYTLKLVDVASGDVATIDAAATGGRASFAPDGLRLAYTSEASGREEVRIYDLATGIGVPVIDDGAVRRAPAFSPDGRFLAYIQVAGNTQVRVRDLVANADVMATATNAVLHPVWMLDRGLMMVGFDDVRRVRPAGAFRFDDVLLPYERNVFSAVATDAAGNVSAPAAPITLLHDRATLPDLVVTNAGVMTYPQFPVHGEPVRISATVRNDGEVAASNISVEFMARGADGRLAAIGSRPIATLAAHQQAVVSIDWNTAARIGGQDVVVRADPANAIVEVSELNNEGSAHLVISADGAPTVSVIVDRTSYPARDSVVVDAEATNPGAPEDFVLDVRVEDDGGYLVTSLRSEPLQAFGFTSARVRVLWPAAGVFAGNYRVRAVLRRADGGEIAATAPFSITADREAQATIVSDRAAYQVGDAVQLTSTVRNAGANADLGPVHVHVRIVDADDTEVFAADREVALLLPGAQAQLPTQWVAASPGAFTAHVTASQDGQPLAAAHIDFSVSGVARLRGQMAITPSPVAAKSTFAIATEATNTGSLAVLAGTLRVTVMDVERQQVVRQFERLADLLPGASVAWQVPVASAGLELKSYSVLLQLDADATIQTLAVSTVTIVDRQAPVVAVASPANGAVTNTDVTIDAVVSDDASGVERVEVQVDGGAWTRMAAADLSSGRFRVTVPTGALADGTHVFVVRAFDRAGNSDSTATEDPNPVSGTFVADRTPPAITVTGIEEGGVYQAPVQPVVVVTDAMSVTTLLNAQAFESGTPVTERGDYTLSVVANDAAGNVAMTEVHFRLQLSTAPEAVGRSVTTAEDQASAITLTGTGGTGALTFTLTSVPAHGELTGTAPNLTYTPAPDYFGPDGFTFLVSDGTQSSAEATIEIAVTPVNDAPVAHAGNGVNVTVGESMMLDGTGSHDPEASVITYAWRITSVPAGSAVTTASLSDHQSPRPSFTPDVAGDYTVELVVSDGMLESAAGMVTVHAEPPAYVAPNANAGSDQQVLVGATVTLDGSQSNDPDHAPLPLTFQWRFSAVPANSLLTDAHLVDATGAKASFSPDVSGEYVLALTVSDGALEGSDQVRIIAAENTAPAANAGADVTIALGATAHVDGSASADADGGPEPLRYAWTVVSRPDGSSVTNASIVGANTARAAFVPDRGGVYVLSLTVSDGIATSTDNVAVTVQASYHVSGAAYLMHSGFQEKLSLDVLAENGSITATSSVKYVYVRSRVDLVSTAIRSLTIDGDTATIAGDGKVNGVPGYKFVVTVSDGSPDAFGITITRPDGSTLYQYAGDVAGGDLMIAAY